jgi:hypothetical protein
MIIIIIYLLKKMNVKHVAVKILVLECDAFFFYKSFSLDNIFSKALVLVALTFGKSKVVSMFK